MPAFEYVRTVEWGKLWNVGQNTPALAWPEDLGQQIGIESAESGQIAVLDMVSFAAPCQEFSHFAAQSQHEKLLADKLKSILKFLGNGRRGFLLLLNDTHDEVFVQPGDRVFVASAD